jgi:ribose/xylose/arabinose/galactoside ABC-type transport system permease subunit
MHYRFALAALYVVLVATVAATLLFGLNPALITVLPLPVVTLATMTLARWRVRRHGDHDRGTSRHEPNG